MSFRFPKHRYSDLTDEVKMKTHSTPRFKDEIEVDPEKLRGEPVQYTEAEIRYMSANGIAPFNGVRMSKHQTDGIEVRPPTHIPNENEREYTMNEVQKYGINETKEVLEFGLTLWKEREALFTDLSISKVVGNIGAYVAAGKLAIPAFNNIEKVPDELSELSEAEFQVLREMIIDELELEDATEDLVNHILFVAYHGAMIYFKHIVKIADDEEDSE